MCPSLSLSLFSFRLFYVCVSKAYKLVSLWFFCWRNRDEKDGRVTFDHIWPAAAVAIYDVRYYLSYKTVIVLLFKIWGGLAS